MDKSVVAGLGMILLIDWHLDMLCYSPYLLPATFFLLYLALSILLYLLLVKFKSDVEASLVCCSYRDKKSFRVLGFLTRLFVGLLMRLFLEALFTAVSLERMATCAVVGLCLLGCEKLKNWFLSMRSGSLSKYFIDF